MSTLDWGAPFEALRDGQRFESTSRTITESDLVGFAALTGDWHPQHSDPTWAASSRFGERIAHGMLVASYALGLVSFDPERVVALRRISEIVFKRPVMIGDSIRVEGKVAGLAEVDPELGMVSCDWRVRNQAAALVCRIQLEVLWRRDADSDASKESGRGPALGADSYRHEYASGVFPC